MKHLKFVQNIAVVAIICSVLSCSKKDTPHTTPAPAPRDTTVADTTKRDPMDALLGTYDGSVQITSYIIRNYSDSTLSGTTIHTSRVVVKKSDISRGIVITRYYKEAEEYKNGENIGVFAYNGQTKFGYYPTGTINYREFVFSGNKLSYVDVSHGVSGGTGFGSASYTVGTWTKKE